MALLDSPRGLIDPDVQTLGAFRLNDTSQWVFVAAFKGKENVRAEPFQAVELELGALWIPPETASAPEVDPDPKP